MSISLTAVQQIEFDALVKAEYRSSGFLLRDSIRLRREVVGKSIDFRKVGQVIATNTAYMQSVTVQDPNYSKVNAILEKYTAATGVDYVQDMTVNFDTKMENASLVADALGRRSDQICINAIAGATFTAANTIAVNVSGGNTNFDYDKYTRMMEFFENNAVPLGDRFVAMSASNLRKLMNEDQFTSRFYTENRVIDKGFVRDYLGFNVIIIPEMTEGGLPKAGNIRDAFAWHRKAMGMGIGANFRTEINYLPRETTWLINGIFSAGAVAIDTRGILKVECDESV